MLWLCPNDAVEPRQILLEHLQIQEQYRLQCLVLRRRRHAARDRQMRQERFDLPLAHRRRMTFSVKQNEPPHSHHVDTLCGEAVVANAKRLSNPARAAASQPSGFPRSISGKDRRSSHEDQRETAPL